MSRSEQVFNIAAGVSVLSWACLGIVSDFDNLGIVRICVASINAVVGSLFLIRAPLRENGSWQALAVCLPSFLISGLAFKLGHAHQPWSYIQEGTFATVTVMVVVSLISLGRNFAVFPALRRIVRFGPYRIIRHPVYLAEWLLVLVCCLAYPHRILLVLPLVLIPFLVLRIQAEEKVLIRDANYTDYQKQVKWRLVPGIW